MKEYKLYIWIILAMVLIVSGGTEFPKGIIDRFELPVSCDAALERTAGSGSYEIPVGPFFDKLVLNTTVELRWLIKTKISLYMVV
ncbi:MAG: hypothetical protein PVF73_07660 [Bacteroidales bacterium]|jgi:hypothetical protein